ncbi:zinc ribbon domain-containing protein [Nocardioides zeae]|uniref:Zn-ribbon domain-containing OB-fold protein n=1 Tax=Nocardioides zeae TaxID=1457234 RepID=A0A6P0HKC0_9ACTN|nr:hypothetical protein [Nocardioides zeae]
MTEQRVLPLTTDHDTAPFWAAAAEERLVVQHCDDCDLPIHLPRGVCPRCHGERTSWREVRGAGRLHSWTVVEHQVHPGHPTPYTSVLVELEDLPSVRFLGSLPGRLDLEIDQPMTVRFERVGDTTLPQWEPVSS